MTELALITVRPELFLALAGMAILVQGVLRAEKGMRVSSGLTLLAFAITIGLVLMTPAEQGETVFTGLFAADGYGVFLKILILVAAGIALLIGVSYAEREAMDRFEYPVLLLFATLGMMMMVSAADLISLYVGLELQSLALYVVAAFRRDTIRSTEAGLKYFVLGALSSGMLLYGASMIYGFTGSTSFADIALSIKGAGSNPSLGLTAGLVFLLAGLAFKISAVPFHMWTPDVYEGAPTPVTAFFAAAPKLAAMGLMVRVLGGPFLDFIGQWQQIIIFISIASMVLGAFAAIPQNNIKRLMAYSSIGNIGYALVGLAAGTRDGVGSVLIYMTIYLAMTLGSFVCILAMRQKGRAVEGIGDLAGLSKTNPAMAFFLAVFMFSMAGIPPLAGFFGKLFVFKAAIEAELYALAIIGIVTSVVSAFYYLRIIKIMYFDEPIDSFDRPMGWAASLTLAGTGLFILLFFIGSTPILVAADRAASVLLPFGG